MFYTEIFDNVYDFVFVLVMYHYDSSWSECLNDNSTCRFLEIRKYEKE